MIGMDMKVMQTSMKTAGAHPSVHDAVRLLQGGMHQEIIAGAIARHQADMPAGAHNVFLGQVRPDTIHGAVVEAIVYEAYAPMAETTMREIAAAARQRYRLNGATLLHSVGTVRTGEISLCVIASAAHRHEAQRATEWIVERVKHSVPIWKKLVLSDGQACWKDGNENTKP